MNAFLLDLRFMNQLDTDDEYVVDYIFLRGVAMTINE